MHNDTGAQSPRQSSEKHRISILKKAFDVYDVDGSGAIDYAEFKNLLEDLGWPSHEEFLNRAVRVLDQDRSGEIDFPEFQKWTEFAYASRILYRQEMYGSGPRYSSVDENELQPVEETGSGKKGLVIRRASLTTVFEGMEKDEQEMVQSAYNSGDSSDEDGDETRGGPSLRVRGSGSSNAKDEEQGESYDGCYRGYRDSYRAKERFKVTPLSQSVMLEEEEVEGSKSEDDENRDKESNREGGKNNAMDGVFSTPMKEMANMVLTPRRRGNKIHTSRSRSKSAGILGDRWNGESERRWRAKKEPLSMGGRAESKMTVRMRWACGQFRNTDGDDNHSRSNSASNDGGGSENGEEDNDEELMKRSSGDGVGGEGDEVWENVGVDLRRIRSD